MRSDKKSSSPDQVALLTEFLDHDDRPSFLLDAHNDDRESQVIYKNPALQEFLGRVGAVSTGADTDQDFKDWAAKFESTRARSDRTGAASKTSFGGREWTSNVLKGKWKIVYSVTFDDSCRDSASDQTRPQLDQSGSSSSANPTNTIESEALPGVPPKNLRAKAGLDEDTPETSEDSEEDNQEETQNGSLSSQKRWRLSRSKHSLDWTRYPSPDLPGYCQFLLNFDWASTPLGPMDKWPDLLRATVVTKMSCPDPRLIIWGHNMCLIYNEACLTLFGDKHPSALGRGPADAFAELWKPIKSIVKRAMRQGRATKVENLQLTIQRDSFGPEESYWSFTMLPIIGTDGKAHGALDEFVETTAGVVGERRMATLIALGEKAAFSSSVKDLWQKLLEALEPNIQDVPYALLYSINVESAETGPASHPNDKDSEEPKRCFLEASIGISKDHPALVRDFVLTEGVEGFAVPFRRAWTSAQPTLLQVHHGTLPKQLAELRLEGRGFGDPITAAVALPIPPLSGTSIRGFLMLGINPRRPYDADYQIFVRLLNDRLVKAVASVFLPEEQRKSQEQLEAANSRHASYSRELLKRKAEAESSEATFTALAESAPIGCAVFEPNGHPTWMNQAYIDLSGVPREDFGKPGGRAWSYTVIEEDREFLEDQWRKLAEGQTVKSFEFRVKRPPHSKHPVNPCEKMGFAWLLGHGSTRLDEEGRPHQILGWLTDISHQKWSQHLQDKRLEDALETKRQSENFIDMTSHEMRNPLSAILQSADGILTALNYNTPGEHMTIPRKDMTLDHEAQEIVIDSAQTIILCAQHQKRIVDDILTLSKLDSNLLVISPDVIHPIALVERSIKMYEAELNNARIKLTLSIHQTYEDLSIERVVLDPSRVLQVLINLLTNAIKFTRDREKRVVTIFLSASYKRPSSGHDNLSYIPCRSSRPEHEWGEEWGNGQEVFLQFAVEDTGRGLNEDEMRLLFHRFSQASPKTYGQYGGSGLGLFISRELTELQGGQIGVASQAGKGSTFAFYIKARRYAPKESEAPSSPLEPLRGLPLRQPSNQKIEPVTTSAADPMPLTSPSDPSWAINVAQLDSSNVEPVEKQVPQSAKAGKVDVKRDFKGLSVLIVEDNAINQRVLAQQLQRAGCTTHVANHGLEALALLEHSTFASSTTKLPSSCADPLPDTTQSGLTKSNVFTSATSNDKAEVKKVDINVVLMDLEMPIMDGLTCVQRIRELEGQSLLTRHVPVIAVTANARSEQIALAMSRGMDLVVTKPFRIPDLLPQMDALVRRIRMREAAEKRGTEPEALGVHVGHEGHALFGGRGDKDGSGNSKEEAKGSIGSKGGGVANCGTRELSGGA